MESKELSIVIVTYKSEGKIYNCLDSIPNNIKVKIVENSNDKTIYIPLSGGLDSRLIIAKFHEKKYKNIKAFSYGLKNNADALIAKKVADHLDVKWDLDNGKISESLVNRCISKWIREDEPKWEMVAYCTRQ